MAAMAAQQKGQPNPLAAQVQSMGAMKKKKGAGPNMVAPVMPPAGDGGGING